MCRGLRVVKRSLGLCVRDYRILPLGQNRRLADTTGGGDVSLEVLECLHGPDVLILGRGKRLGRVRRVACLPVLKRGALLDLSKDAAMEEQGEACAATGKYHAAGCRLYLAGGDWSMLRRDVGSLGYATGLSHNVGPPENKIYLVLYSHTQSNEYKPKIIIPRTTIKVNSLSILKDYSK